MATNDTTSAPDVIPASGPPERPPIGATSSLLELGHASTGRATFVVVPLRRFYAIDGIGDPRGADFQVASEALRAAGSRLDRRLGQEGVAFPSARSRLECVWWPTDATPPLLFARRFAERSGWRWRQLMELADRASDDLAFEAIAEPGLVSGRPKPPMRVVSFAEGAAAQLLHVGGHDREAATLKHLHAEISSAGYRPRGWVHTLVLADPDHVPQGRGREILRQPIA